MPYDIAGALQNPNIIGNALAAGQAGRAAGLQDQAMRKQNALAQLAGQAYSAPAEQQNALVSQMIGIDPQSGMEMGSALAGRAQAQEVDHAKRLGGAARYMAQALQSKNPAQIEGAWQAVRPYIAQLSGKEPPQNWDPAMEPALYQAIAATGGMPDVKGVVVAPGSVLANPSTGERMLANPASLQYHDVPMGEGKAAGAFDPSTGTVRPAVGGVPQGGPQIDPMQPFIDQANAAIQMGAPQDQVEAWLQRQAQQIGAQPQAPGQGGNQLQTTQAVVPAQFGVGTPAGPKPQSETWSQPVDEAGPDGKPIRVQYSNTGERRVVEGAAPIPKGSAAKKSDEQIKMSLYTKGLADDAYAYAAAATGKTQEELRSMTPQQVAALVAQGSRWSSGPVMGRIPGINPIANADLAAYANSASGKMARMNNPTGPVSNSDFEIAAKSVWGPDKPDDVNAQLILNALQREKAAQGDVPAGSTPNNGGGYRVGQTIEVNGKQYRVTGGDPNDPDVEPL
ncbi:hypothetical protein [Rhodanobacter caeni]